MRYEGKHIAQKRRTRAMARRRAAMMKLSILLVALVIVACVVWLIKVAGSATGTLDTKSEPAAADTIGYVAVPPKIVSLKLVEPAHETETPETPVEPEETEPGEDGEDPLEPEKIEAALVEQGYFRDDVPLSYEDQDYLHTACEEAGVPYALALAVIQRETSFRNIVGDDGASEGYMQVQERWHKERMERLGVTDLMDPFGNFRVGCDFLAELIDQYESVDLAVTVYNRGHNPGYITQYGKEVMGYYEEWRELVGDD